MMAMRSTPNLSAIPPELQALHQWVVWKGEQKVPYCPVLGTLKPASSTDPATWGTYAEAVERHGKGGFWGIGFMFSADDPYCGIDLDDCLDAAGEPYAKAAKIIADLNSYTEVSPSGKGVKIILRATKPGEKCKRAGEWAEGVAGQIEIYDRERYFTITGAVLPDAALDVMGRQPEVDALYARLFPAPRARGIHGPATGNVEWCRKYLEKCPESITGQNGHDKALRAACECMRFGLSDAETMDMMRWWSDSKSGGEPWNEREIAHKIDSARAKCAASGEIGIRLRNENWKEPAPVRPPEAPSGGASAGVVARIGEIASGRYAAAPWKWDTMSRLTQSLLPGSVTLLCGDPGAGKTFFVMDAALGWLELGVPFALFELEEDRNYYLQRALAILEGNGDLTDMRWVKANAGKARDAAAKHAATLDALGRCIYDSPRKRVPLMSLADWYASVADKARVVVIDPVTAASTTDKRWVEDGNFMERVKSIALDTGTSLVLVTHPKVGRRPGAPTLDDLAGGADYPRFSQTVLVLANRKGDEEVACAKYTPMGTITSRVAINRILHLRKTRNGRGSGADIGYTFDPKTLGFTEHGVLTDD